MQGLLTALREYDRYRQAIQRLMELFSLTVRTQKQMQADEEFQMFISFERFVDHYQTAERRKRFVDMIEERELKRWQRVEQQCQIIKRIGPKMLFGNVDPKHEIDDGPTPHPE